MQAMNEAVKNRFGELLLSLCEAEVVIAQKDAEIARLRAAAENAKATENADDPAQEMLQSR